MSTAAPTGSAGRAGWAGVDVGGSGVRARVQTGDGSLEGRCEVPLPRARGQVDIPALCRNVLAQVHPLITGLGAGRLHALALGMTGLPGLVPDPGEIAHRLFADLDVDVVVIAGDALTTHLGALDGGAGGVVAAGTGVIGLGTDHQQIWHQVDGRGLFVGDEGSGAWIGQRGLQAALRASDGRIGGSPALWDQMQTRFGGPLDLVASIHGAEAPAGELASFAPAVAEAARAGDQVAWSIWQEAGHKLAETAVAAVRGLPGRVTWGGGLFDVGDLLIEPFRNHVQQLLPDVQLDQPAGTGLDGAMLLAQQVAAGQVIAREPYLQVFTSTRQT
ncbi:MAG TPA: BadF/BadG/BcrA/BcrD ATPase family protein [Beutenbergiaceae bacterium]|nr:BadF/BadG/BcrA/BcrD ATPase family protein [Beutenbergiaceae bacterium]